MLVRRKIRRKGDAVLHLHVIVRENIDVEKAIDVRHGLFEIASDEPANGVRAVRASGQPVVVVPRNAGVAERAQCCAQAGCLAHRLEHADAGVVDACATTGSPRRRGVEGH